MTRKKNPFIYPEKIKIKIKIKIKTFF